MLSFLDLSNCAALLILISLISSLRVPPVGNMAFNESYDLLEDLLFGGCDIDFSRVQDGLHSGVFNQ